MMQFRKGLLIDRDGVLIENLPNYVRSIEQVRFVPNVEQAIQKLWEAGYILCIVTNQAGVAKGLYTLETVHKIHSYIEYCLRQYGQGEIYWYVCPHQDSDQCNCRKPKPGLLQKALAENNLTADKTWMIGDNLHDIEAGRFVRCHTALVQTGLGKMQVFTQGWQPDWIVPNFPSFVDFLLKCEFGSRKLSYY